MPEIKRFGSFKLLMNGDLLAGRAPSKVLREVRRWIEENRADLSAMWDEFQR